MDPKEELAKARREYARAKAAFEAAPGSRKVQEDIIDAQRALDFWTLYVQDRESR